MTISTNKEDEEYMTKADVKEYLGIGDCCVKSLFSRPNFPCVELGRGKKAIKKRELIKYLDSFARMPKL